MRILLISDHADPLVEIGSKEAGGQNIYVYYLSKFLANRGIFVDVYTRWDRKNKKNIVEENSHLRVIRVKAGPKRYIPRDNLIYHLDEFEKNILKRVKSEKLKYDLIHTNYWFSGLIGLKLRERLKIPQVHIYHSLGEVRFRTLSIFKTQTSDYEFFQKRIAAEKSIAKNVDLVISSSPNEKELIVRLMKVRPKKVKVIPIGVDQNIFRSYPMGKARNRLVVNQKRELILYVGRIEWRKGIGTLIFALKAVARNFPRSYLYIVGGGRSKQAQDLDRAEKTRLVNIAKSLGLKKRVIFLGPKSQRRLFIYYNAADVCVVPSYYEPFGIVPLEAMACGTPVVASRTGGLQFSVEDGKTGYLTKPRDYKNLARAIKKVLRRGKKHFKDECQNRVKQMFDWDKIIDSYIKFYNFVAKTNEK